ncbi:MAG: glycosyltransferase family 1 protein [Chloroflexi bacterium]|nr:glycosyltransferase family 1 protein [Chloroflexota bacterium]MCY4247395.1 glycosyltransferase family 1 protein [Chloroflexota bacterium]
MRVALVSETFLPKVDGIVKVACLLLDHLSARGIEAMVIAPRYGDNQRYKHAPVHSLPSVAVPLYPEARLGFATSELFRAIAAFQPDVAHLFHPAMTGLPTMAMLKWLGVPIVASFHLDYARLASQFQVGGLGLSLASPLIDQVTRRVFNWADARLAPSQLVQGQMQALGIGEVGLWRRGVDAEAFHPRFSSPAMRAEMSQGCPDDTLLVYVGRLSDEKQLEHIRPVLEQTPNLRLALVGDGPARQRLEQTFAGLPVTFMGYLRGDRLASAYASADIFVFPSRLETFGLVVVEAMAAGLPVVAARVGGVTEVVREGSNGYTFASGDTSGLAQGIHAIAKDRETLRWMGRQARAYAETQSWSASMNDLIAEYARLIVKN